MSLSKQFYISLSLILFIMFTGNVMLNIQNSKELLDTQNSNKTAHIQTKNVPSLFVESFPISTVSTKTVKSTENFYDKSKEMLIHTLILFFITIFIMIIYINFVSKPLKYIEKKDKISRGF